MRIAVIAPPQNLPFSLPAENEVQIDSFNTIRDIGELNQYDALIHLGSDAHMENYSTIQTPVFIHSVLETLAGNKLPANVVRMNAWPGFLEKPIWELSGVISPAHQQMMSCIGKQWIVVPDIIGFISCRVIAMIINEAFFAVESGVSSEEDINTAMRLGTNYPYGPFEWANLIGKKELFQLLNLLAKSDPRYTPCPSLMH
jgi:3-hydroxybutyryl-CoA dehydrogenase